MGTDRLRKLAMLEFADDVGPRHRTPGEVKITIPAPDELSIHVQPTFSLSYGRQTRCGLVTGR
jgi:hypothetical protein